MTSSAGCWWLTPLILPTEEAEIRRIAVRSQTRQIVGETLSRKTLHTKKKKKIGLVEWLKMKALCSSPTSAKKKNR
jgi:hypothetical protein